VTTLPHRFSWYWHWHCIFLGDFSVDWDRDGKQIFHCQASMKSFNRFVARSLTLGAFWAAVSTVPWSVRLHGWLSNKKLDKQPQLTNSLSKIILLSNYWWHINMFRITFWTAIMSSFYRNNMMVCVFSCHCFFIYFHLYMY